jgi:nicotinamide-nucleotide amidase
MRPPGSFYEELHQASEDFDNRLDLDIANLLQNRTIACAESMTAGSLSERLTRIPGSASYFLGAVVCYSIALKLSVCGVMASTLSQFGPVSEPVAKEMAMGIQKLAKSQIGLSITGYAGPDRHHPENTGLVFIGLMMENTPHVFQFRFEGSRPEIKAQAVQSALVQLRLKLTAS